jgi:PAS domain S-box-containing protein
MVSPVSPASFLSLAKMAAIAAAYAALIVAGRLVAPGSGGIPFFWPAPGFLLAALLLSPSRSRARLFAFAMAAGLFANLSAGPNLPAAAGFWLADLATAALTAYLTLRVPGGTGFLGNLPGTVRFFTQVVPAGAACGALLHSVSAALFLGTGWAHPLAIGFLSNAAGLAVMVPAILSWAQRDQAWEGGTARQVRFGLCAALALSIGYLVDTQPGWLVTALGRPLPYAIFPFLLWAALDFGVRGAATVHLCAYLLGAALDSLGHGPYQLGQKLGMGVVGPLQWFPYAAAFCSMAPAVLVRRQKRIEEELRVRESRYGSLWSSKLIGIFVFDMNSMIVEANDTFLAMMGIDRAEMESGGIDVRPMTPPESLAAREEKIAQFRRDGSMGPFEREWVLRDGRRLLSMVYSARMEGTDLSLSMVMDVRELDQARKELRLRDSRYRGLLSSTIMGVFVSTSDGSLLEANDTFLAMIRKTREDLEAGRIHSRDMATPEYHSGASERRRQFEEEGRMGPFDREWVLHDGSRLNTLFFATKLENGDALCMVFNTNELKRTKLELRAVESRFRSLLEANILGVAVFNEKFIAEEANEAFLAVSGHTYADLENGAIKADTFIDSRPPNVGESQWWLLFSEGGIRPQETEWTRKDGTRIPVFRGITRLDESSRWLVVALDLTELKRTQAELESAKVVAEAASLAKSDFLAHMSHEIRTPLNGLLGMLAFLLDSRLNAEQMGYARSARESGAHLLALINQILDFSKIERGHMVLDREMFAMESMVEGALSFLTESARKKGIILSKRVDPAVPARLVGDATRLRQILINLAGNAVKFSPGGTVDISVRLLEREGDRCRIGFQVSDEGPGIAPATLARLFQPFRQGDDSMARAAGGTGLGLAISRELARRMGGDIEVESEVGKGSRFRFYIEADALEGISDSARALPLGGAPVADFIPGRPLWAQAPRILVADDHPVNVNVATIMLRKLGCQVDAFPDGPSALAAAAGKDYALAFMDCQMPGLDGFETTRRWRAVESAGKRRVPIIALTAHAVSGMREKCLDAGMDDYLTKPFNAEDIERMVRKWIPALSPGADSLVDRARLSSLDDGTPQGRENTRRLFGMFLESTRTSLLRIRADHRSGDPQALAKSLHHLKGSCATVGAVAMTEQIKAMEADLKRGGTEEVTAGLPVLDNLFARTERILAPAPASRQI